MPHVGPSKNLHLVRCIAADYPVVSVRWLPRNITHNRLHIVRLYGDTIGQVLAHQWAESIDPRHIAHRRELTKKERLELLSELH